MLIHEYTTLEDMGFFAVSALVFGLLIISVSCVATLDNALMAADGNALLAFKSHLIDPAGHLNDWHEYNEKHCSWTGVTCNAYGRVTELDISDMNLTGYISDDIQLLTELQSFKICCNGFSTALPASITNLTHLVVFDISHNCFVGGFPSGLGRAHGLVNISAYSNNFTGKLPEDLGGLSKLEYLDLRGSYFDGSIPAKSFKGLLGLRFLGLSGNYLTGQIPPEIGQLSLLKRLIIGFNRFDGGLPAEIGNLSNLEYLDLTFANLDGRLPKELGALKNLHTLFLYKNRFTGSVPPEFGNMSSMMSLDLSNNFLSGAIPPEIGKLRSLQLLSIMYNNFTGIVPGSIADLPNLKTLEIWNNSLSGQLPQQLGRNSGLEWLDVSSNFFSGPVPPHLCSGGNLTKLILFNNGFSGPIPDGLAKCPSLWRVRMQNNQLSGLIPAGFGRLPNLTMLQLSHNRLTGTVPGDLSLSHSLSSLDLSYNLLHGVLDSDILKTYNLQKVSVSNNNLTGSIPDRFNPCLSLSVLDLSNNIFFGSIPVSISKCEKLVALDLKNNNLSGSIPAELAVMRALAMVDLSMNNLTGTIPSRVGSSPSLEIFNVSYNNLSGSVPTDGMFRTATADSFVGNHGLCGGILPPCSTMDSENMKGMNLPMAYWVIVSLVIICGALVLVAGGRFLYKRYYSCSHGLKTDGGEDWPWRLTAFQRLHFTSSDILAAIKDTNIIGMGSTGTVYKADIPRGDGAVAVKKLWRTQKELGVDPSNPSFIAEVDLLGKLRHRNILRLLGYCYNDVHALLIYEYMPNGSLAEALHGKGSSCSSNLLADWVSRYNIAVGIAQGLCYLHHDCFPLVVHRDVKSNNILLDSNLDARVADFGLAKIIETTASMSMVAGSYGYIAPEYAYTLNVDEKSDIYSFGVVLMELLTGRKPVDPEFGEAVNIVEWVRDKIRTKEGMVQALDSNIGAMCNHVQEEMILVLRIALLCTSKLPRDRPSMRDVVTMLAEAKPRRKSSAAAKETSIFSPPPIASLL